MHRAAVILSVLLAATACGSGGSKALATVSESGVQVRVTRDGSSLAVRFTPDDKGFHVYSKDLDAASTNGLGFPTKVELGNGLSAAGAVSADKTPQDLAVAGITEKVPVYPDGPVTLTVPFTGTGGTVTVSYAACSDQLCLKPVVGKQISVTTR